MPIQLLADSCCDMTPELREELDLVSAPLEVTVDGRCFVDDDVTQVPALLKAMKASQNAAKSACPSPESFASLMRPHEACLVVTLSSRLSGSYHAACVARDMVLEETPGKRIYVLDSKSASAGEIRLALYLRCLIDQGYDFDTIVEKAEEFIGQMRTLFVLEDIRNLVKNGRIGKIAGLAASVLSLCPLMGDDGNGAIACIAKVRGMENSLRKLIQTVQEVTAAMKDNAVTLVMTYCNCETRAEKLREELLGSCPAIRDIVMVPTGILSSMYANDGGIVLAFEQREVPGEAYEPIRCSGYRFGRVIAP